MLLMPVYVLAQLKFKDRRAYDRYQAAFAGVFRQFNGRLLVADESPQVLEGGWTRDKVVLMSFPDEASCLAWSGSPAYQAIAVDRKAGADAVVLMLKGFGA
jgi:uncharacterized protein (DUF1330 family)